MPDTSDTLSLDELIGQVMMVGFWGDTPSKEMAELIERYHVGNIILFSRNIRDTQQALELTHSLQMIAKQAGQRFPLLIAIDQENGIVQRLGEAATIFPGNMALGAIGSEEIARDVALATGQELRALGINMNLAPVVDVNNNPANPVIGVRSFGEDAWDVARLGAAMVRGYRQAGVIATLKHFPGHGDTAVDSHLALPTIPHDLSRLESLELAPFRRGIEAGAKSVMIAHVAFPALTGQAHLPATLSPAVVRGLLRERCNFTGVILSDCLEMRAISETFGTAPASVMALQAGIDLVLVSHHANQQRASIEAIHAALRSAELAEQTLRQAAARVLRLKAATLSWENLPSPIMPSTIIGSEAHRELQRAAYERAITLVRDDDRLLPLRLRPEERIVVVAPPRNTMTMVEDRFYSDDELVTLLRRYHDHVELFPLTSAIGSSVADEVAAGTSASDIVIMATVNAHLDERQAEVARALLLLKRRVIVLAVRNPYDLLAFPQLGTYLATYEYTRPALNAAARVLFGESEARGRLPVSIPGII